VRVGTTEGTHFRRRTSVKVKFGGPYARQTHQDTLKNEIR